MERNQFETLLTELDFSMVNPKLNLVNRTLNRIEKKKKVQNMTMCSLLILFTCTLVYGITYVYLKSNFSPAYLKTIALIFMVVSYNYVILFIFYYFKLFKYLKSTFKINQKIRM